MFKPIQSRRTFEEAVEQIADAIRIGDFHVGDRLPSERTLAAEMRISRPTLREALSLLVQTGAVEVKSGPGGGAYVKSEMIPLRLIRERSEMRVSEVAEVLEARRLFEPRVAQLAGLYATEDDLVEMRRIIELQRARSGDRDHDRFVQLDTRFHLTIAKATQNETIVSLMKLLHTQLEIARDMAPRTQVEPKIAIGLHEGTLQAIKTGDPEMIDEAMDEHLAWLEGIWEQETGRARLRKPPDFLLPRSERAPIVKRPAAPRH
jgi:GntR family transcriptional regulator, transcriptional repressor for pyruvate dehydrogenase complex